MTRRWIATAGCLLGTVLPGVLQGQERRDTVRADTTIFRVGEIVVQATRAVATTGGASALEVRLDSLSVRAAPTLEEVLRELPVVEVRSNSRGEAQFSLRGSGSDARQVAVLVDGVPLNLGWDDRADLSVLPATSAGTLTLVRGLPSVLYGPNVLGGVVEVGVGRGLVQSSRSAFEVTGGIDHLGGFSSAGVATLPFEKDGRRLMLRFGGGYRDRPGVALAGGVHDPPPPAGGDLRSHNEALRVNSDLRHGDGFMALRYTAAGGAWLSLAGSGFLAQRGVPAELHTESPRLWRYPAASRFITVLSGGTGERTSPLGGRGDVEASVGLDLGHSRIVSYETAAFRDITDTEKGADRTVTLRLLADQTVGSASELRGAVTYADINHDEQLDPGGAATYRQRLWSAAAETAWRARGRWLGGLTGPRISLGYAVDGADTPESGDKPPLGRLSAWGARLGISSAATSGRLLLHAGVSRRSRFPALRELYSGALGKFEPNPDLQPETLTAAEAGLTTELGTGELQVVGFHHRLTDAIVRVRAADGKFQRVNRDEVRATGIELLAAGPLGPLALGGDLTLQRVRLIDLGTDPAPRPEYQPQVMGGANLRVPLPLDVGGQANARYMGRQYCVDPNVSTAVAVPASTRIDLELARQWRIRPMGGGWLSRLEVRAAVDNVGDRAIYDQCGLPQPGRTFRLQFRMF